MPEPSSRPTLRRSWRLLRAFRVEQTDPDHFYGTLASDSVTQLGRFVDLAGARMLDVGGGPGYFASAFAGAGASYTAVDADVGEMAGRGAPLPGSVLGSGMQLPFRDDSFDVTFSSNVLEHVHEPWTMAEEMVRATRPGGTVFISYTVWWGPWGGHETSPWHVILGGRRAADRYARRAGHRPKNDFGRSLFAVTVASGLTWARTRDDVDVIACLPRYLPRWSWWVLRIPVLREIVTWNLVIVLRPR